MKPLYVILLFALTSCSAFEGPAVFDRVAASYADDPQKKEAVHYLQQYAKYHYGVSRHLNHPVEVERLRKGIANDSVFRHHLDSLEYSYVIGSPVMDEDTLTDEFLRENIDLAFEAWQRPWARDVSFDDFCRYILPYRNGDEELHGWRRYLKEKYESAILDSVADPTSIREVVLFLIRQLRREIAYGPAMGSFTRNLLTVEGMERIRWMECRGCAHYVTLAMRACGIPCAMITTHWRFTEVPHTSVHFPAVGSNDRAFRLTIGDSLIYMGEPKDTMASWCTWQTSYEPNEDLLELLDDYSNSRRQHRVLQRFALPVTRQDVTPDMSTTYRCLSLPVPDSLRHHRHLFLCRFHDWKWYPIRAGKVDGDSVRFSNSTIRQWYRLGYPDADSVKTFGGTFTLVADSGAIAKGSSPQIRPYNLTGDTVLFKMVYGCKADETRLTRRVTTFYWNDRNEWQPFTQDAILWGFNEKTMEWRVFDKSMRGVFKPVFHLLQVRLPKWTVFTDNETPRPLGYLFTDEETGEGCFMQF
ncbi:MAG: hypothetical protein II949_13680 [Prevotella sp.]|nr:hypothetical protein [Prevotella sp.]